MARKQEPALVAHLRELLEPLGTLAVRPMFGAHGLYADGVFFGLVADDVLYLKVDAATEATFAAAGSRPFVFTADGAPVTTSYWTVPDDALDGSEQLLPWARLALAAARRKGRK